jgi:Raf kinase inhibitor-like YbhB/YbcL family protein
MQRFVRILAVVAGVAALVAGAAAIASAQDRHGAFGYHRVRQGIPDRAVRFRLSSPDLGNSFPASAFANAFGCTGTNAQPRLTWSGAPSATRSFAVTMYDPDAPTGSGFWHWLEWDVPATTTSLGATVPVGAVAGTNDAGMTSYLGPCPPVGDVTHHYEITVYALDVTSLGLPAATPAAVTTFTMGGHILGFGRITVTASR